VKIKIIIFVVQAARYGAYWWGDVSWDPWGAKGDPSADFPHSAVYTPFCSSFPHGPFRILPSAFRILPVVLPYSIFCVHLIFNV